MDFTGVGWITGLVFYTMDFSSIGEHEQNLKNVNYLLLITTLLVFMEILRVFRSDMEFFLAGQY